MKSFFLTLFSIFSLSLSANAQYTVQGKLTDEEGIPLSYANILLLSATDSTFVTGQTSDEAGTFTIVTDQVGTYFLSISSIGYETNTTDEFLLSANTLKKSFSSITLVEGGIELDEVQITGERPLIVKEIDRTVINIENRVTTAGATALEVLERSPGVVVNRQGGTIALLGKDGVNVMINEKLEYMPTDALFNFLEGLNADNIKSIELITTPPANFDAQGNAGFINIVLKNDPRDGLNGNYALTAGYGRGEVGNASVNINFRKNRLNAFGSYSHVRNGQEQFTDMIKRTGSGNSAIETLLTFDRNPLQRNHNARMGLDYQLSDQTTIGVLLSGYYNQWDMDATVNTRVSSPSVPDTLINSINGEENDWQHIQTNFNLTHTFANGSRLSADANYLYYNNQNPNTYNLTYQVGTTESFRQNIFTQKKTPFTILVGQLDYRFAIGEKGTLSSGVKYVQSDFENDVSATEDDIILPEFTSTSDLTETIMAAYTQLDYSLSEKTALKAGLRYEHTDTDLFSTNGGQVVDRDFGMLFPSVFLSHSFNPNLNLNTSYSKRINRPAFSDMAPFFIFLDPTTSFGGNAALQPAIAHTVQADLSFRDFTLSTQYTWEDSTIVRFQNRFNLDNNNLVIVPDNLREQRTFSTTLAFPVKVTDWWSMRYAATYLWQQSTSVEELGVYTFDQHNLSLNGSQSFKLTHDFSLELSGFYQTTSLVGNVKFDPLGILNAGLQKKLSDRTRLVFNVTDVLNSLKRVGITDLPEENRYVRRTFDFSQRTFKVTLSASFGNQKVMGARKRSSGADEKKRVN